MINRILFLIASILFLSIGAPAQVPLNPMGTPASDYASLAAAVAAIGAAPTTLIISKVDFPSGSSTTVPSTLILDFRSPGTLLLQPGHKVTIQSDGSGWPISKIFNEANAAPSAPDLQGPVSFSGNRSMREISISWWGAVCDNSTDDTMAINAAFVAGSWFTVTSPDNVICRVGFPKLQSHTVLRLGANSMFKVRDSAPDKSAALVMRDCDSCVVDGGVFDGNSDDAEPEGHPAPASSFAVLIYGGTRLKLLNGRSQYARAPRDNGEPIGNAGDGIYLGIGKDAPQDVIVDKWTSTTNERQAISIIGCRQCRFTNNYFLNTKFAVEGAGMDFEPNPISHQVTHLNIAAGTKTVTWSPPPSTPPFSVHDIGCQINFGNFYAIIEAVSRSGDSVTISRFPPVTLTNVSGTIFNKGSRRVNDLVTNSGSDIVTSATAEFTTSDIGHQIKIDNFYALITDVKPTPPNTATDTATISLNRPATATGVTGTITTIEQRFEDVLVEGNTISGNVGNGILFSNKNHAPNKGIRFVNNSIRNNQRTGLSVAGENTDGLVIANNTIEGNKGRCTSVAPEAIGLTISNVDRGASVVGNTIANNDCYGIFITASSHVTLADNKIYRNGYAGMRIRTDTTPSVIGANSLIHGNSIFNNGTKTIITPTSTLNDYAHTAGIVVTPTNPNTGWEITSNRFGNDAIILPTATQYDGIMFLHPKTNGVIIGPNTYAGLLGLNVRTTWPPDSNPALAAIAALTTDVKTNRFCWNIDGTWQCAGGLTAKQTLDFPLISANRSSELTIPVTGATVGDVCYASPSTTLESGLSFSCYISSPNTATVRLGNVTTGAINPASRSWKVAVSKF